MGAYDLNHFNRMAERMRHEVERDYLQKQADENQRIAMQQWALTRKGSLLGESTSLDDRPPTKKKKLEHVLQQFDPPKAETKVVTVVKEVVKEVERKVEPYDDDFERWVLSHPLFIMFCIMALLYDFLPMLAKLFK